MKDIKEGTRNKMAAFAAHGASNHSKEERADLDYYATDPQAVKELLKRENFSQYILEPACGGCHITDTLKRMGFDVMSSDIVDRGAESQDLTLDFFSIFSKNERDIITNPPYKYAKEFVEHALEISLLALLPINGIQRA